MNSECKEPECKCRKPGERIGIKEAMLFSTNHGVLREKIVSLIDTYRKENSRIFESKMVDLELYLGLR